MLSLWLSNMGLSQPPCRNIRRMAAKFHGPKPNQL
jgi:hypothetical protein